MIAAVLTSPQSVKIKSTDAPKIKEQQVRIKVEGCGICASSIPLWEGREWFSYPVDPGAPGHEGWGVIDMVGSEVDGLKPGDRVAFLSGHSYAEYDVADENSLVKLPDAFAGKPFPGEPLGCAMNIFERSDIQKGDVIAIIGMGFLGVLLCQLAKSQGAKVIAVSRRGYSLEVAKRYGADECIQLTNTWETAGKVAEITGNNMCARVIEATGKQNAIDVATEIVSEGGRIIIAGYHQDGIRHIDLQKWNWKGIDVINAHERNSARYLHGMRNAVEAVLRGIVKPEELYTDILPLSELSKGFYMTCDRPDGFMKALVQL